ncbi:bifunctional histidinol-phosphatase/imidazoleglycerol-phosphate dehydratase HisB [Dokdonella sp.]|uniref:bifunctional histidinol-phosphatase/imidazoleglycerol-phosphate dehydratase HisB n=1 Tax=Dokdonella sp. TaxID=2291710 RepID=UPI00261FEE0E|nr:bifunctional histidinol-phosphatase/imidazoleglycerol-phosphate dehydratase HisB [Dokdonella sp.]
MAATSKILFVDRDGTLIEEPPDQQIDSYEKFRLVPGSISALRRLVGAGYELVMVSNQDGLGTPSFPEHTFAGPQQLLLDILASEGIRFREILIDRSFASDRTTTRKPGTGLVRHWLASDTLDRARSAVVGDRETDVEFARNLGVRGFRIGNEWNWSEVARALLDAPRRADVSRTTRETLIKVSVDLDGTARPSVTTGIGFFDHMIEQLGVHGGFALNLRCSGDLHIDEHHTVEDCALALGQALREALGDRRGIGRYGFLLPMDESLAQVALDLSGRACFVFDGTFPREQVGTLPTELVPHFFRSLGDALGANLHLSVRGDNTHHMIEACFKAVGRALREAVRRDGDAVPSSKGVLA